MLYAPGGKQFHLGLNNKLPRLITSARPFSMVSGCTQSATGGSGPICLPTGSHLGQVVEKLQDYPCRRIILIAQEWPNLPWFWDLVTMSSQIPFVPVQPAHSTIQSDSSQESVKPNLYSPMK